MGEYDLFEREQHPSFLYLKSYISISFLIESLLSLALPTLLLLFLYQDISSYPNRVCDSNFFHLKKIEEKDEIPSQFIRNKKETEKRVTESDRQQSTT